MNRYALRKDKNQGDIVDALRKVGATVRVMHDPLDLIVGFRGRNFLLECKQEKKKGWASELTPAQIKFCNEWQGQHAIVYTAEEAIAVITGD